MLLLVAITGLAFLVRLGGLNRSLWLDEAWVANSILADSVGTMLRYPDWVQSTPVGFLLAVRGVTGVLPASEWTLRLVPLMAGTTLVLLAWLASRQFLDSGPALVVAFLVAVSPGLVEYSRTLKPYVVDAWVGTLVLAASTSCLDRSARWARRVAWTSPLLLLLSYSAVLFLPGLIGALALHCRSIGKLDRGSCRPGTRKASSGPCLWKTAGYAFSIAAWGLAVYLVLVAPVRSTALDAYWNHAFARLDSIGGFLTFQAAFARSFADVSLVGVRPAVEPVVIALALGGVTVLTMRRDWRYVLVLLAPACTAVALNVLRVLPYSERLLLGLAPVLLIAVVAGLDGLISRALRALRVDNASPRAWQIAFGVFALLFVLRLAFVSTSTYVTVLPEEDVRAAVDSLRALGDEANAVYVHASVAPSFRYYTRDRGLAGVSTFFGRTDAPCCGRVPRPRTDPESEIEALVRDSVRGRPFRVAFVATGRTSHWRDSRAGSPEAFAAAFRDHDCSLQRQWHPRNVIVQLFSCPDPAGPGLSVPGTEERR